jgi:hypothetical protein
MTASRRVRTYAPTLDAGSLDAGLARAYGAAHGLHVSAALVRLAVQIIEVLVEMDPRCRQR